MSFEEMQPLVTDEEPIDSSPGDEPSDVPSDDGAGEDV
jgi:hypothetical protein